MSTTTGDPAAIPAAASASRADTRDRKGKRRRYFIEPDMQVRMTVELVALWLVGAALALVNLYVLDSLGELYQSDALRIGPAHWEENLMVWAYGVISVMVAAIVFLLACVFYTHRIAGPQRKLEDCLLTLADGDLRPRVSLRKGDHLRALARAINHIARKSEHNISTVRTALMRLRQAAEEENNSVVLECCAAMERVLSDYKLTADHTK